MISLKNFSFLILKILIVKKSEKFYVKFPSNFVLKFFFSHKVNLKIISNQQIIFTTQSNTNFPINQTRFLQKKKKSFYFFSHSIFSSSTLKKKKFLTVNINTLNLSPNTKIYK